MTLPERLARKALPCRWPGAYADKCTCEQCERRVDVEDAIREAIEACAEIADENPFDGSGDKEVARSIRALCTEEETP